MNNIIDYIKWRGDLSFKEAPFNDVDAAILSEITYFPLTGIIPEDFEREISFGSACEQCGKRKMMKGHGDDSLLAEMLAKAPRFAGLMVSGFRQIVDDTQQFCALTVKLGANRHIVAFQGTDENLIGWKEDMQLSYMNEIPSQKKALEYINDVGKAYRGELLTCGHSKGGNLAIYASAFCGKRVSKRISRICCFDGPGFNEDVIVDVRMDSVKDRIITYAPQGSLISMLLEHNTELVPVQCKGNDGMTQHNLFNWEMDVHSPLIASEFSNMGNMNREVMRLWVSGLTYEQREDFVEALFSIISDRKNVDELLSGSSLPLIVKSYSKLEKRQRQVLNQVVNNLGTSFWGHLIGELKEWFSSQ